MSTFILQLHRVNYYIFFLYYYFKKILTEYILYDKVFVLGIVFKKNIFFERVIYLSKDNIKTEIVVKEQKISILRIDNKEYISLTDLARYADEEDPRYPIQNWMRNKDVISYLGLWESIHNENFKGVEFDTFKNEAVATSLKYRLKNGLKRRMRLALFQNQVIMVELMLEVISHLNLRVGFLQNLNYTLYKSFKD